MVGPNGGVTTTVSVNGSYTFSAAADNTENVTLDLQTPGFQGIVRATGSSAGAANATEQALGAIGCHRHELARLHRRRLAATSAIAAL